MRAFGLLTLTLVLTGCHGMPEWNPQGRAGCGLLSRCRPAGGLDLLPGCDKRRQRDCREQPTIGQQPTICPQPACGPLAAYGMACPQYQVVPGRTHRALAVDWKKVPVPCLKVE